MKTTDSATSHIGISAGPLTDGTVELILSNRAVDPNAPYPTESGITPLHLAAELGRADIGGSHLTRSAALDWRLISGLCPCARSPALA